MIGGAHGTNEDAYALSSSPEWCSGPTTSTPASMMPSPRISWRQQSTGPHFRCRYRRHNRGLGGLISRRSIPRSICESAEQRKSRCAARRGAPRATSLDDRASFKLGYRPGGGFALLDEIADGKHPEVRQA